MKEQIFLDAIEPGQCAVIEALAAEGPLRRRLLDLGLAAGTRVECLGRSPAGDPSAYLIRGAVIALRRADCARIPVRRTAEGRDRAWD